MVRYESWTENEWKTAKCPKKNFDRPSESWRTTTDQDHFKFKLQGSPAALKLNINGRAEDFCTVPYDSYQLV